MENRQRNKQEAKIYEDENYKNIFNNKKNFKEFLRDFTEIEAFKDIDENEIEDQTERFVEVSKPQTECDTLKMVKIKDTYALVLIEHQSSVDHLMPYRLLDYMSKIWGNYIKEQEQIQPSISKRKDFKLPAIVPIVYHTGRGNWTSIQQFEEKIKDAELFKGFIPSFKYGTISLDKISFEELKQKETVVSLEMLLLKIKDGKDLKEVKNILSDRSYTDKIMSIATDDQKDEIFKIIDTQLRIHKSANEDYEEYEEMFNSVKGEGVSKMVNWFKLAEEEGREEGIQLGIQKGRKEGIEQGIERGKQEQLKQSVFNMLELNVKSEIICKILKIDEVKLSELELEYQEVKNDAGNELVSEIEEAEEGVDEIEEPLFNLQ